MSVYSPAKEELKPSASCAGAVGQRDWRVGLQRGQGAPKMEGKPFKTRVL